MEEEKDVFTSSKPKYTKKTLAILFAIILLIILIDQATKFIAFKYENIDLIPNFLNLHIAQNRSGTYGVGSDSTFSYVLTNLIVVAVLFKFIISQNEFISTKIRIFLSFIIAGGISNTIDRLFRGYVVEFIDFKLLPVINIADIFIIIGWFSFVAIFAAFSVIEIRSNKEKRKNRFQDIDKKNKDNKNKEK